MLVGEKNVSVLYVQLDFLLICVHLEPKKTIPNMCVREQTLAVIVFFVLCAVGLRVCLARISIWNIYILYWKTFPMNFHIQTFFFLLAAYPFRRYCPSIHCAWVFRVENNDKWFSQTSCFSSYYPHALHTFKWHMQRCDSVHVWLWWNLTSVVIYVACAQTCAIFCQILPNSNVVCTNSQCRKPMASKEFFNEKLPFHC